MSVIYISNKTDTHKNLICPAVLDLISPKYSIRLLG